MVTDSETDLVEITQVRSAIGAKVAQQRTLRALGLRRIHQTVTKPDRPEIRGMLATVAHLIEVRRPGDDGPIGLEPGQEPGNDGEEQRTDLK
jgi:large subunit ribosomal protein L30